MLFTPKAKYCFRPWPIMMFSLNLREFNCFPDLTKIRMLWSAVPLAMLLFHYCFKPWSWCWIGFQVWPRESEIRGEPAVGNFSCTNLESKQAWYWMIVSKTQLRTWKENSFDTGKLIIFLKLFRIFVSTWTQCILVIEGTKPSTLTKKVSYPY